jgi:hypothetical protein
MYAVIGRPRFVREVDDEEELRLLSRVVATCEQSGGFRGLCTVRISERELVNIFFWESRADGERGRDALRPVVLEFVGAALDGAPEFTAGEVLFTHGVVRGATAC